MASALELAALIFPAWNKERGDKDPCDMKISILKFNDNKFQLLAEGKNNLELRFKIPEELAIFLEKEKLVDIRDIKDIKCKCPFAPDFLTFRNFEGNYYLCYRYDICGFESANPFMKFPIDKMTITQFAKSFLQPCYDNSNRWEK